MPTNDYRLEQLSITDLSPGATATVTMRPKRSIQSDAIDSDEAKGFSISVVLTNPQRQDLKAAVDVVTARMDFRRAAKAVTPTIDLNSAQAGEP